MRRLATAAILVAALASLAVPAAYGAAPAPASLLLATRDLPAGYVSDAALENADATARSHAYAGLIAASSFAGYRIAHAAVVQYVARLHRRADAATFLSGEGAAVDRSHSMERLTLEAHYGDRADVAYQARGSRGEEWMVVLFARGPYVTMLGSYDAGGAQAALDTLQRLAALAAARLRVAAAHAPDPPAPRPRPVPPLRITALVTTTRAGRATDVFRPHSPLYWRVVWRIGHLPRGSRETVREWVWRGSRLLYRNGLTDRPFTGDNVLRDHLLLRAAVSGRYSVTVTIAIGRLSVRATHTFRVVASTPRHG